MRTFDDKAINDALDDFDRIQVLVDSRYRSFLISDERLEISKHIHSILETQDVQFIISGAIRGEAERKKGRLE